jgi:hypothetical protein
MMMRYRDIEYALVEDVERGGWKWSASVVGVVITGEQPSKSAAAAAAEKAIDRAVVRQSSSACLAPNDALQCPHTRKGDPPSMSDTRIDFSAPATLRKWPSVNKERVSASFGARPYIIIEDTLDECIRKFMVQPEDQHHLYEIHTAPQSDLVSAIVSADHVVELARLRDFLGK